MDDIESDLYDEVKAEMTFSNLANELRIKSYFIERDDAKIKAIHDRVKLCRQYIESTGFYGLYERIMNAA